MRTFIQKQKTNKQIKSTDSTIHGQTFSAQNHAVCSILHFQRTIGNQAVIRLLKANAEKFEAASKTRTYTLFADDFSRIPLHTNAHYNIQRKLKINTPGNVYEEAADHVAEKVMNVPKLAASCHLASEGKPGLTTVIWRDIQEIKDTEKENPRDNQGEALTSRLSHLQRAIGNQQVGGLIHRERSFWRGEGMKAGGPFRLRLRDLLPATRNALPSEAWLASEQWPSRTADSSNFVAMTHDRAIHLGSKLSNLSANSQKRAVAHEAVHLMQQNLPVAKPEGSVSTAEQEAAALVGPILKGNKVVPEIGVAPTQTLTWTHDDVVVARAKKRLPVLQKFEGQYAPHSRERHRLIAHELNHIPQQRRAASPSEGRLAAMSDKASGGVGHVGRGARKKSPAIRALGRPTIQRWEASEHVHIGQQVYTPEAMKRHFKELVKIDASIKLQLAHAQITYADAVAMADLFDNFEEMYNAPRHEIDRHLDIIKSEKEVLITQTKGKPVKQKWSKRQKKTLEQIDMRFTKATGTRYIELAKKNYSHFSHGHMFGGMNNIRQWKVLHIDAANTARKARKAGSGDLLSQAFAKNSFADHFLSDAFAVGHLTGRSMEPEEISIRQGLKKQMATIIADVLAKKYWYIAILLPFVSTILINLVSAILAGMKDIAALPFKIIHDLDNKYGRKVKNAEQEEWEAYGDKYLIRGENLRSNYPRVINAVKISKDEIVESAKYDKGPDSRPEQLYPCKFGERRWSFKDAVQALKQLIQDRFSMVKLLWKADDFMRQYIARVPIGEMYQIPVKSKVAMIKVLLDGPTLDEDERAILKVLRYSSTNHLWDIVTKIGFKNLKSDIHGKEYGQFITLLASRFYKLPLEHRVYFIRLLLKGATLDVEENGILRLLQNSKPDMVYKIIREIGFGKIAADIHGGEYNKFIYILVSKYRNVNRYGKKELIESLLKGTTGDLEEWAIKEIIRNAQSKEVAYIINAIGFGKFDDNIHGAEYDRFLSVLVDKYRHLNANEKVRLIKGLCSGRTSEVEEETIVLLLKDASIPDFRHIVRAVGKSRLFKELTGREEDQFEVMLANAGM